jgi:hypothetical protein
MPFSLPSVEADLYRDGPGNQEVLRQVSDVGEVLHARRLPDHRHARQPEVAENTMVEFGREELVRDFRQQFENEMTGKLEGMIEELTGRKILGYQSQIIISPDIVIEIFFFDRAVEEQEIDATARGQLDDHSIGEARAGSERDDMTQTDIAGS